MLSGKRSAPLGPGEEMPRLRYPVLGVKVDAVQIPAVIGQMVRWIDGGDRGRFIAVAGMHGVTEAVREAAFRDVLLAADLVVPDGMPLVWLGRARGHALQRRVYGPELMMEFCRATACRGYRHFLYGGAPGVAEALGERLTRDFPGVRIAGTFSPPFTELSDAEREEIHRRINGSRADILWVGLSTPKQEKWILENRAGLQVPVLAGVGAAFDLNSGRLRQAPPWMRENGLEWFFRLSQEPRRLWKRYLVRGPQFVFNVSLELMKIRNFD